MRNTSTDVLVFPSSKASNLTTITRYTTMPYKTHYFHICTHYDNVDKSPIGQRGKPQFVPIPVDT